MHDIQNRSLLYEMPPGIAMAACDLVPPGLYQATLTEVKRYVSNWGERVGFVFCITEGHYANSTVTLSTATNLSRSSKLGRTLADLLARELTDAELLYGFQPERLKGTECKILVDEHSTRCGTPYSEVGRVLR